MSTASTDRAITIFPPRRCRVAHVWLTDTEYAELSTIAERQRLHVDALVADMIGRALLAHRLANSLEI